MLLDECSPRGDDYYWRMQFRKTDVAGRVVIITDATIPVMTRDDLGADPFILSVDMYNILGAPKIEIAHGRGFGYRIPHLILHPTTKTAFRFYYKIIGITMKWKEFILIFFQENASTEPDNLALMTPFEWKSQADLSKDETGFIHKGYKRYVVYTDDAAEDCMKNL